MNARAAFSGWETGEPVAGKLSLGNPPEARKHQRCRVRSQAVSHKPIWARNEREEGRFRYSFRHHDDTRLYMEQYRKENAFSTLAVCRTEGDMQTEKSRLYNALGNGYLSQQLRLAYDSYKTALEAAHMRKVMESKDRVQREIQHDAMPKTITLQLPLPPIPLGRSPTKTWRKTCYSPNLKEECSATSPVVCQQETSLHTFLKNGGNCACADCVHVQNHVAADECGCPAGVSKLYMEVMHDCTTQEATEETVWRPRDTGSEKMEKNGWSSSNDSPDECNYKRYMPDYLMESRTEQLQWHTIVGALPSVVSWLQKLNTARRAHLLDPLPHELAGVSLHKSSASARALIKSETTTTTTGVFRKQDAAVEKSESQPDLVASSETDLQLKLRSRTEALASFSLNPLYQQEEQQDSTVSLRKNRSHHKRLKAFAKHAGVGTVSQSKPPVPHYMASFSKSILIKPQSKASFEE